MNDNQLPINDGSVPVPVFDCHVIVRQTDTGVNVRTAAVRGIEASGATERDALLAIVKKFKDMARQSLENGNQIPFVAAETPGENESERWIPVHL